MNTNPPCKLCGLPHGTKPGKIRRSRRTGLCFLCESEPAKWTWCKTCHAHYRRFHTPKYSELSPEKQARSRARAYLNVYLKRGKVKKGPCEVCGIAEVQAHHDDYSKPIDVRWLCRSHHDKHHSAMRRSPVKQAQSLQVTNPP